MIRFEKKPASEPAPKVADENRFDQVRDAATEGHKKSAAEAGRRRAQPEKEDERLI